MSDRPRVLSGIQPTGAGFHLGSYLGAVRNWVAMQDTHDAFYCVVDLHAITVTQDPALAQRTRESVAELLACGLDPARCTVFVQSHVPEHAELGWMLSCITGFGEASRMTQFKDKGGGTVGLFCYPVLQAADILLYQSASVPVGDDQRQHLELTRDLAQRFNTRFGSTFVVPDAHIPPVGARVLDLQDPARKMSKSLPPAGTLYLQDDPAVLRKKVRSAVTDAGRDVAAADDKPGITNLLTIAATLTGRTVPEVAAGYAAGAGYGGFKSNVADAVIAFVEPMQARYRELLADEAYVDGVLAEGAARAHSVAAATMAVVRERLRFLPARR